MGRASRLNAIIDTLIEPYAIIDTLIEPSLSNRSVMTDEYLP
jgi:hypothetical protein